MSMRPHHFRFTCAALAASLFLLGSLSATAGTTRVGEPLTVARTTPIAALTDDPDAFEGQMVRVEGTVAGVCQKMGCWMEVADADGRAVRVKVEDGVMVFPAEAEGHDAAVQGKVEILPMTRDEYLGWKRHLAEDAGRTFDESTLGQPPYRLVQLRGHGAEIEME